MTLWRCNGENGHFICMICCKWCFLNNYRSNNVKLGIRKLNIFCTEGIVVEYCNIGDFGFLRLTLRLTSIWPLMRVKISSNGEKHIWIPKFQLFWDFSKLGMISTEVISFFHFSGFWAHCDAVCKASQTLIH